VEHERTVHLTDVGWVVFEVRRGRLVPLHGGPYRDEETALQHLRDGPPTEGPRTPS
jgi:hypothetical protein